MHMFPVNTYGKHESFWNIWTHYSQARTELSTYGKHESFWNTQNTMRTCAVLWPLKPQATVILRTQCFWTITQLRTYSLAITAGKESSRSTQTDKTKQVQKEKWEKITHDLAQNIYYNTKGSNSRYHKYHTYLCNSITYHQSPKPVMISISTYHLACIEGSALQCCSIYYSKSMLFSSLHRLHYTTKYSI